MNPIKTLEKIVEIRQKVQKISEELKFLQGELDLQVGEMIEFLKHKRIIETRSS